MHSALSTSQSHMPASPCPPSPGSGRSWGLRRGCQGPSRAGTRLRPVERGGAHCRGPGSGARGLEGPFQGCLLRPCLWRGATEAWQGTLLIAGLSCVPGQAPPGTRCRAANVTPAWVPGRHTHSSAGAHRGCLTGRQRGLGGRTPGPGCHRLSLVPSAKRGISACLPPPAGGEIQAQAEV